jgi:hypothetical protein
MNSEPVITGALGNTRVPVGMVHRICAFPIAITWILGAIALNGLLLTAFANDVSLHTIFSDWHTFLLLMLAFIPSSVLGYFVGMLTVWPLVRIFCSRYNGYPLATGDQVVVLSGPLKNTRAEVYEITTSQGGWDLARLNLGEERRKKFRDLFEEYSLLKVTKRGFGREEKDLPAG